MPLYHFALRDGEALSADEEGTELLDIERAQIEATEFLADVVVDLTMRVSRPSGHFVVDRGPGCGWAAAYAFTDRQRH
jgi:hypothetical protein